MLGITKDGSWYYYDGSIEDIEGNVWFKGENITPAVISPDKKDKALLILKDGGVTKLPIDVIFPVLHGKNGEDIITSW